MRVSAPTERAGGRLAARCLRTVLLAAFLLLAAPAAALAAGAVLDEHGGRSDLDARQGAVEPTAAQLERASALGASARWNRFGTVQSLIAEDGGYLAEGLGGDPVAAARSFLSANRVLFRLSDDGLASLELVNDVTLPGTDAHALLFRQRFGGLPAGQDGLIAVGLRDGNVAYVSSSAAGDGTAPAAPALSPAEAFVRAATDAGEAVSLVNVTGSRLGKDGWTLLDVSGFAQPQRARLVALPTPVDGVRPAYETIVLDVDGAETVAYTSFVDAVSGAVLVRRNQVERLAAPTVQTFSGSFSENACGAYHDFEVAPGTTTIEVVATADVPANDIVLELHKPQGNELTHSDTGTSPEAILYAPGNLEPGTYSVRVCPYPATQVEPLTYTGTFSTSDAPVNAVATDPRWQAFPANPPLGGAATDTRDLWCWVPGSGCDLVLQNLAARAPWDVEVRTGASSRTTKGNAALSGEAWASPLTPAEQYRPVAPDRSYSFPWTNQWRETRCSPGAFTSAQRNDVDAATANLFAMHNRLHDWSYFLGFTEQTYNLQDTNFGNGGVGPYPLGRENDPEIGNVQAGALTGGYPSFLGRDNANQITLNDGIAPITNMYLWQPIPAAFYGPCVDGDYDMSVIGHEYTHAISNRMIGGPDANITGNQGRAMGESWSDLAAVEYLYEYGFAPTEGENPFAVGAYVTGNTQTGIRNHAMNASPLNYSDVGYDYVCNTDTVTGQCVSASQVHADGEIWSAVNYDLRQALVAKYGAGTPQLQRDCADGKLPASQCPGNRRWIQLQFDSFLLLPASVSMLDARDAILAADLLRFGGANRVELWRAFARRGLGQFASTLGANDDDPVPSFESPAETNEATVTFQTLAPGGAAVPATVYVGRYEARVTPVADTDPATALGATARFVPGTYDLVVRASGYGLVRRTVTLGAGKTTRLKWTLPVNLASSAQGATVSGDGVNLGALVDDTEGTNWAALGRTPSVAGTQVTVDLSGGAHTVRAVNVSAMLRLLDPDNAGDPGSQSRFSALRSFELWTCDATVAASLNCTTPAGFTKIYTSPADAFPAGVPRPLTPDLTFRTFDVPDTKATHVKLVVLANQCTGGPAYAGEQDADPAYTTDCAAGSARDQDVRAAELQVFSAAVK